ncbi:MAG: crossover junction endodeoxyribonuclease RuvC [candidate division Zixibacteria bacterium]|nr:crossover junction endodeoxyribonuclease RuvC [candidate division Zixibacteria bacterium]
MRILGIDPGLNATGYGILEEGDGDFRVVEAGVLRSDGKRSMAERLLEISQELDNIIGQFEPDVVAVEELYSHYGHPKTAIIMGHARGVVFLKAAEIGVPIYPYSSTRIKKSLTGNGRASKRQMQLMITTSLGLAEVPEPPDVADALAVALCHGRSVQSSEAIEV